MKNRPVKQPIWPTPTISFHGCRGDLYAACITASFTSSKRIPARACRLCTLTKKCWYKPRFPPWKPGFSHVEDQRHPWSLSSFKSVEKSSSLRLAGGPPASITHKETSAATCCGTQQGGAINKAKTGLYYGFTRCRCCAPNRRSANSGSLRPGLSSLRR